MTTQLTQTQHQTINAIQNYMPTFQQLFNNDADRTSKFMIAAYNIAQDKQLANCSPESIINALHSVAELNLSCSKQLGHAYMIPYKNQLSLQIGAKGYKALLQRRGIIVDTYPVFKTDYFKVNFNPESGYIFEFSPDFENRNDYNFDWLYENFKGIIIVLKNKDGVLKTDFIAKSYIESARLSSSNQTYIGQYTKPQDKVLIEQKQPVGIWRDWYIQMAEKTAIKYTAKKALTFDDDTDSLFKAINLDNTGELEERDITPAQQQEQPKDELYATIQADSQQQAEQESLTMQEKRTIKEGKDAILSATNTDYLSQLEKWIAGLTEQEQAILYPLLQEKKEELSSLDEDLEEDI